MSGRNESGSCFATTEDKPLLPQLMFHTQDSRWSCRASLVRKNETLYGDKIVSLVVYPTRLMVVSVNESTVRFACEA